jgi:MarR family transcriptional regulator, organic hydroperoxide resistance regulator
MPVKKRSIGTTSVADTVRVMDSLRRVVRALSSSLRGAQRADGITGAQLFVLRQIAAAPGLSMNELAARTLAGQSTVSEVVAKLTHRGFVLRGMHPEDARQAMLTLTPSGRRAIAGVAATTQERLADGFLELPPAQRVVLAEALEAWLIAAGLADIPAPMFFEADHGPKGTAA